MKNEKVLKNQKKIKRQHATLTLVDDGNGSYSAQVNYQPSLKDRGLKDNSPAVNAMIKLCMIVARGRDMLGASINLVEPNVTKNKLTILGFGSKIRDFLFS